MCEGENVDTALNYSISKANIWQIAWGRIMVMKSETVQIHYSGNIFAAIAVVFA